MSDRYSEKIDKYDEDREAARRRAQETAVNAQRGVNLGLEAAKTFLASCLPQSDGFGLPQVVVPSSSIGLKVVQAIATHTKGFTAVLSLEVDGTYDGQPQYDYLKARLTAPGGAAVELDLRRAGAIAGQEGQIPFTVDDARTLIERALDQSYNQRRQR
jgi:hypothetical protein